MTRAGILNIIDGGFVKREQAPLAKGETVATSSGTEVAADVVIRFHVEHDRQTEFKETVASIVSREKVASMSGAERVEVRLLQAVLSSGPAEWELRITLPNYECVGRFMDGASKATAGEPPSTLARLLNIDGAQVVDDGVPLYRSWMLVDSGSRE